MSLPRFIVGYYIFPIGTSSLICFILCLDCLRSGYYIMVMTKFHKMFVKSVCVLEINKQFQLHNVICVLYCNYSLPGDSDHGYMSYEP